MINRIKTYFKLLKLRKYIRKKLAFHEAGHLIFSYLMKIPCDYISVDFYFEDKIRFQGDYAIVTMNSKSQVYHMLPSEIEDNLNNVRYGVNAIAIQKQKAIADVERDFNRYFTILLAGHNSQNKFSENFQNNELEYLQYNFSQDLTKKNLEEDITRFNYLNTSLHPIVADRIKTFKAVDNLISYYLQQSEVQEAITVIADKVKGNKRINKNKIENILNKIDFLNYCELQNTRILSMI